jgi:hypothetical protein
MQNTIIDAALEYAARGWHVFPAPRGQKKSHKSEKFSDGRKWGATIDPDEIRRDWQRWPNANVGIATGAKSGFFVIEADTIEGHGVDGVGNLQALIEQHGALPSTVEALSPSGSRHIYFRWPDGSTFSNSAGQVAPGVDVRADGGMVIGVPSVKPGIDRPYTWVNSPSLFALADCPAWLLGLCRKPALKLSERAMLAGDFRIDTGRPWAAKALQNEINALLAAPEGQRNATLNTAAFNLGQIVAGGELDQETVRARLNAAAHSIGLSPDEIAATIQSGLTAGLKQPRMPKEKLGKLEERPTQQPSEVSDADPVDLWGSFDPPAFPEGLLPPIIEQFARANGLQMGADPAGLAVAALVTCAAAIPDKVQIKVKRHDDWKESARLWAALVGLPSAKKSPIIAAATGPLCRLDVEMMRAWQARVSKYDALPPEKRKGKQRPLQARLRIEDVTIEAAQQVLEGSPWGVLVLQDELSGWFGAMDKYNGGKGAAADRAFWLRSFNGGQFALNRVSRGAAIIDNLSVCMLGGIQPELLRKIAGDAVDDGLLQRLLPIMLRNATIGRDEPMPPVNDRYACLIKALRRLPPPGWQNDDLLHLDDGAQRIRQELEAKHLELQSLETINKKLASHIGKYDGLFARLCVVWQCIEHVEATALSDASGLEDTELPAIVAETTARRVAEFLHRFLLAHSIAFYSGLLGLSDDHDRLTAIAGHILAHKLETVTNRDVQRGDRTMRGLKEHEIRPLLEQLAALGWLERVDPPRPSQPPHWVVNPMVHQKFAERGRREADRRRQARLTIQALAAQS